MNNNQSGLELSQTLNQQQEIWLNIRKKFVPGIEAIHRTDRSEMVDLIASIVDNADIHEAYPVSSHRKILGPIIVLAKRVVLKILRPIIRIGFARQIILNENLLSLTTVVSELQIRLGELERRLEASEQQKIQ